MTLMYDEHAHVPRPPCDLAAVNFSEFVPMGWSRASRQGQGLSLRAPRDTNESPETRWGPQRTSNERQARRHRTELRSVSYIELSR